MSRIVLLSMIALTGVGFEAWGDKVAGGETAEVYAPPPPPRTSPPKDAVRVSEIFQAAKFLPASSNDSKCPAGKILQDANRILIYSRLEDGFHFGPEEVFSKKPGRATFREKRKMATGPVVACTRVVQNTVRNDVEFFRIVAKSDSRCTDGSRESHERELVVQKVDGRLRMHVKLRDGTLCSYNE